MSRQGQESPLEKEVKRDRLWNGDFHLFHEYKKWKSQNNSYLSQKNT